MGFRYDYNSIHGNILTPRVNYKFNSQDKSTTIRLSFGSGYRVAQIFTEDHAALTGARDVVFLEDLNPERYVQLATQSVEEEEQEEQPTTAMNFMEMEKADG